MRPRLGPFGRAVHLCIDMQVYFAEGSDWAAPGTAAVAPACARLAAHAPGRTVFTRFLPPARAGDAAGQWRPYYDRWASVLADRNDPGIYALLPALRPFVPPARVIDKGTHSGFGVPALGQALAELGAETLILSGVESDVCVLATAMSAIDRGFRVVLAEDALASSSEAGHRAALSAVFPRFDMQAEAMPVAAILEHWTP